MTNALSLPAQEYNSAKQTKVCVVSGVSSQSLGGLASYMRFLMQYLSKDCDISAIARFHKSGPRPGVHYGGWEPPTIIDNGLYKTCTIAPKAAYRPLLARLHHLTSRKPLDRFAVSLYTKAFQPSIAEAMPEAVDVVHYVGNGWELLGYAALAEARKRKAAFTMLPAVHPGTWGDSALDVALYNQADAVLTLSDYERQHLIKHGADAARIHIIGLAPATLSIGNGQQFRDRHGLGCRPLILFVGRKDKDKGYHALRRAMLHVLTAVPDACLVVIGPDREPPYPPVSEGALLDLGQTDENEKEDALAACDLFCMPSLSESFGIVYVEAWAYGKPVVGGLAPAVRELVTDGINGFCVSQDPEAIAAVLIRLLDNPTLREHLGAAGRALQQERFTWEAVSAKHRKIFCETLMANA